MLRIKLLLVALILRSIGYAQTVEINGVVISNSDVENIHVINKTANKFTTTNQLGGFKIQAKVLDTIVFSGIQYKLKTMVVSFKNIEEQSMIIQLTENVNELNEVIVGKVLTGDLDSDIKNSGVKPLINFYDVGIPGYTGRTKRLKVRVKLEAKIALLNKIKANFLKDFFSVYQLDETFHQDFFYFCFDDENFENRCKGKSDMEVLKYLEEKFKEYKKN